MMHHKTTEWLHSHYTNWHAILGEIGQSAARDRDIQRGPAAWLDDAVSCAPDDPLCRAIVADVQAHRDEAERILAGLMGFA